MNTLFMHSVQSRAVEFGKWIASGIYTIGMCLLLIFLLILSLLEMLGRFLVSRPFARQVAVIFKILFPPCVAFERARSITNQQRAKECRLCGIMSLVSFSILVSGIFLTFDSRIIPAICGWCTAFVGAVLYISTIYWSGWLGTKRAA